MIRDARGLESKQGTVCAVGFKVFAVCVLGVLGLVTIHFKNRWGHVFLRRDICYLDIKT